MPILEDAMVGYGYDASTITNGNNGYRLSIVYTEPNFKVMLRKY